MAPDAQLSGSMHDHILTFKADIDIAGTNNTMAKHTFVPVTEKYPWSNSTRNTMKLTRHDVETEADSKMVRVHTGPSVQTSADGRTGPPTPPSRSSSSTRTPRTSTARSGVTKSCRTEAEACVRPSRTRPT